MEDRYHVEVLACHACAARERKARFMNDPENGEPPPGLRYIVTPEED